MAECWCHAPIGVQQAWKVTFGSGVMRFSFLGLPWGVNFLLVMPLSVIAELIQTSREFLATSPSAVVRKGRGTGVRAQE